ncbi:MAG TPA: radical SAM protein [Candidatus Altiarchaeales archaeon]|nr:radical SAM protein [Candidatus Altiarchaeales archaeon]
MIKSTVLILALSLSATSAADLLATVNGKKFRKRSTDSVIREIEYVKSLGIRNFFFFVETFTLDKKFVLELCKEIVKKNLNIKWVCNSRVDTVNQEMLDWMKKAGCWLISFGIESGDQKILDNVNKGITVEQSRKAIEMASRTGIATVGHFIFGLPGETKESIQKTLKLSRELPLNFAEFYIATPFPGCELFNDLGIKDYGDINWSEYEYSHNVISEDLNLQDVRNRAYREFYLRPGLVLKELKFLGVRHLPNLIIGGLKFLSTI